MPLIAVSYNFPPEKRNSETEAEIGWLVAPTPINVEGIGSAIPISAIVSNFYKSTDLFLVAPGIKEEIEARVLSVNKFPVIDEQLQFSFLAQDYLIGFRTYDRGMNSGKDDYFQTLEKSNSSTVSIQSQLLVQRLELQLGYSSGSAKLLKIIDADHNQFTNIQSSRRSWVDHLIGTQIDLTDNNLDPHEGIRLGLLHTDTNYGLNDLSDYNVNSFNLSAYFKIFESDTLLINAFHSRSNITNHGLVDENALKNKFGLECDLEKEIDACRRAETRRINKLIGRNRSGKTSLGGINRMRAYSFDRFYAGNSSNYALEYRLNFSEKRIPINWIFFGGIRTVLQTAFFYEAGRVSDDISLLHENLKSSFGLGFRVIISGLIYRFDLAKGDDGIAPTLFINYPLSLGPLGS